MKFITAKTSGYLKGVMTLLTILFLLQPMFLTVSGQEELFPREGNQVKNDKPSIKERLFFGGSFGLQFGTFTDIEFSPVIGMWVLPRLGVAAGPNFRFYKDPFDRTTIYGARTYLEYLFLQDFNNIISLGIHAGLFLHAEYEALSLESSFFKSPPYIAGRFWSNTILAGGGVRQPIGQRSSLNFTFLWALNDSEYGIYGSPEVRISLIF